MESYTLESDPDTAKIGLDSICIRIRKTTDRIDFVAFQNKFSANSKIYSKHLYQNPGRLGAKRFQSLVELMRLGGCVQM
jgi:hypothetical protein